MTTETIVAVFDTAAHANAAIAALEADGVPSASIQHYTKDDRAHLSTGGHEGGGFWAWLTGADDSEASYSDHHTYDRSIESGSTVVTVVIDEAESHKAIMTLEDHSPIDIEERSSQYRMTDGPSGTTTSSMSPLPAKTAASGAEAVSNTGTEEVLALAAESLAVGKREVEGGTTRVRRYVVERPVEEQVRLRNETVKVFRRPVADTVTVGADAFTDKTIEARERAEEAVVSKTARVVEEVVLQQGVEERVETVRDTLRHDEVEIQEGSTGLTGGASMPVPGTAAP